MSAHTPGPWKLIRFPNGPRVLSDGGYHVATVIDFNAFAVNKGNARLIAAAPELLAALKAILSEVDGPEKPYSSDSWLPAHLVEAACSATAKAEGRA